MLTVCNPLSCLLGTVLLGPCHILGGTGTATAWQQQWSIPVIALCSRIFKVINAGADVVYQLDNQ